MTTTIPERIGLRPAARVEGVRAYTRPRYEPSIVLRLDNNEGTAPGADVLAALRVAPAEALRRYPDASDLERDIAKKLEIDARRLVVTNGGDEAIDRVCRVMIEHGRALLTHDPVFEMIPRAALLAGGSVRTVPWLRGSLDINGLIAQLDERVGVVAVVSPCNPTGGVVATSDLLRLADAARSVGAILLADLAYVEFADEDPMAELIGRDNVVVVRTFSKAFGLAGLRVGYAIASEEVAGWLRAVGGPYPVSGPALLAAREVWRAGAGSYVSRVRFEREQLVDALERLSAQTLESQGNFVLARFVDAEAVWSALRRAGVAVRRFEGRPGLEDALRIGLPGDERAFAFLLRAFEYALDGGEMPRWEADASSRAASVRRRTNETSIRCEVRLDGLGVAGVRTGLGFLDHMLAALSRHSGIDIDLACEGDLEVDDHHTVEDCAIVLGEAIDKALGVRAGIARFADAYAPLDEALARAVVDLSGRPSSSVSLGLVRQSVGDVASENLSHFVRSLADRMRASIHLDVLRGENDHHKAEAAFKALALALGRSVRVVREDGLAPSTKGVL